MFFLLLSLPITIEPPLFTILVVPDMYRPSGASNRLPLLRYKFTFCNEIAPDHHSLYSLNTAFSSKYTVLPELILAHTLSVPVTTVAPFLFIVGCVITLGFVMSVFTLKSSASGIVGKARVKSNAGAFEYTSSLKPQVWLGSM